MPRYEVMLSTEIKVAISITADSEEDAEKNWHKKTQALADAKLAVSEEASCLEEWEFDVEYVSDLEGENNG